MRGVVTKAIGIGAVVGLAAGLLSVGCAPPQQREAEFRLQKAQTERDTTEVALRDERARTAALSERLAAEEQRAATAEAEAAAVHEQLQAMEKQRSEALAVIEQRANTPLARPSAPASILPAQFDEVLRAYAQEYQGRVSYARGRGALSFASDELFGAGGDEVRAEAQGALRELAAATLRSLPPDYEMIVVGHTDDTPIMREDMLARYANNWQLSVHRAMAVKDVLVRAGIPAQRFGVMGYGAERPSGEDRARNRRVEIFFVRKGDVQSLAPVGPQ